MAVDATGVPEAVETAIGLLDRGGRMLVFGVSPAEAAIRVSPFRVYNDEITITGSMAILRSFGQAVDLLASGAVDPRPLLSEPLPLEHTVTRWTGYAPARGSSGTSGRHDITPAAESRPERAAAAGALALRGRRAAVNNIRCAAKPRG